MTTPTEERPIQVTVNADKTKAEMFIPPGISEENLNQHACMRLITGLGIVPNEGTVKAVAELILQAKQSGKGTRGIVAETTLPVSGDDGSVEWLIGGEQPQELGEDPVDFYQKSAYTLVEPEQVIAMITPETRGTPGTDLFGKPIAARGGKPVRLKLGKTIQKKNTGELIAKIHGPLVCDGDQITVLEFIEVPEFVDFSTGNINFDGDVHIRKGVRDMFTVEATGNVIVDGLVEAATIRCGGHLAVLGGFAGREKGTAEVGKNMSGKYLDNVHGEVKGELQIDREIANCELTICGALRSPGGTVMGGKLTCQGEAEVAAIGSPSGVPTVISMLGKKKPAVLTVHRWLRADTVIQIAGKAYKVHTDVRGPVRISMGRGREVVYARDQAHAMPLVHIANSLGDAA
ncbi:MAG: FapA family protein [Phycisphaerales bacterium]